MRLTDKEEREIKEIKAMHLWGKLYGDKEYAFDFANKLIIKNEYRTKSLFSWDTDKYEEDNEEDEYIANIISITIRDQKPIFDIDDKKYMITKNHNYSYSILTGTKISDENCPINFDLFLNNKITNYEQKDYSFITIAFRKMNKDTLNIFSNYLIEYLKIFNNFVSFDIDYNNFARVEIKFQFLLSDEFDIKKTLEIALTISTLMPLIVYRLSSLGVTLWKEELDENTYYNIFITSARVNENYFELKNIKILGMITAFENSIFVDENTKKLIVEKGVIENNFTYARNSIVKEVFQYNFTRMDIAEYNKLIFSKTK